MGRTDDQNSKVLFLWLNDKEFHAVNAKRRGVNSFQIYKDLSKNGKLVRNIFVKFDFPGIAYWLNDWKYDLLKYKVVIIHASILTPIVVKYIRKKNKNIRIIVWYWNPVEKCVDVNKFSDMDCEIWSFDENDCRKYNLNFNTQYYFCDTTLSEKKIDFDVFFVGGDKGRINTLMDLKRSLDKQGVSNYFHITDTGDSNRNYKDIYSNRITYSQVLDYISASNVIIDFVSDNQGGLTLRPLEALYFKKKLITNDTSIKECDFYNASNIYILEDNKSDNIKKFIRKPYEEIDSNIFEKYDFSMWIKRFNV